MTSFNDAYNKIACNVRYDIAFISYNEKEADHNWNNLLEKYPFAKRTHGVKGIHQAHIEAAKLASTPMFYIVDADAHIVDDFNFSYIPPTNYRDAVHVWRSKNPINGLIYGYGGIKLFPRNATINTTRIDTRPMMIPRTGTLHVEDPMYITSHVRHVSAPRIPFVYLPEGQVRHSEAPGFGEY